MVRLYADEQFPRIVSELLRNFGHDVWEHLKFVRTDELADRGENQRK